MPDWEDFYKVLGVDPEASPDEIKRAYRARARDYHPDLLGGVSEAVRRLAEEKLKEVNRANEVLSDPEKRQQYHAEWLRRNSRPKPEVTPAFIRSNEVVPGRKQASSFVVKNVGGPYTNIQVSSPDSWVKLTGYESLADNDELPLRVDIEAEGQEWGKTYVETITVWLDDQQTQIKVELRTKPAPEVRVPPRPKSTRTTAKSRGTRRTAPAGVTFRDANLEAAIRAAPNMPTGAIIPGNLRGLTRLSANSGQIRHLTGLEHATRLTYLSLWGNQISDISPLSSLTKLTSLNLLHNRISEISPLSSLTKLTSLDLRHNQISDISPLSSLTNLSNLYTDDGPVGRVSLRWLRTKVFLKRVFRPRYP